MDSSTKSLNTGTMIGLLGLGAILSSALPAMAHPLENPVSIAQTTSRTYVGLTYRTLPKGLENRGGWVIDSDRREPTYGGSVVRQGQTQMLWLERYISQDSAGRVTYQVVDVLNLPAIAKSQVLAFGFCQLNGRSDRRIAAIVTATNTEFRTRVHRAWQLNINTGKIVPISTRGIACENPGWGV